MCSLLFHQLQSEGLADLMKKGQVGKPKRDPKTGLLLSQHLGRTDVTMNVSDLMQIGRVSHEEISCDLICIGSSFSRCIYQNCCHHLPAIYLTIIYLLFSKCKNVT